MAREGTAGQHPDEEFELPVVRGAVGHGVVAGHTQRRQAEPHELAGVVADGVLGGEGADHEADHRLRAALQGHDLPVPDAFGEAFHALQRVVVVDDQVAAGLEPAGQHVALLLLGGGEGVHGMVEQLVVVAVDEAALAGGADPLPAFGEQDVALAEGGGDNVLVLAALDGEAGVALEGELDLVGGHHLHWLPGSGGWGRGPRPHGDEPPGEEP
jgi:hypothetical protein